MVKQKGIALLQVLLLSGMLGMMAIFFLQGAKGNTAKAIALGDLAKAQLLVKSTESQLLFDLLTKDKDGSSPTQTDDTDLIEEKQADTEIASLWNFYGEPFKIAPNVTVALQDANGLVSLFYSDNSTPLINLAVYLGLTTAEAQEMARHIQTWQGEVKRQSLLTSLHEQQRQDMMAGVEDILKNADIDQQIARQLLPYVYPWSKPFFNPLVAPDVVLASHYGEAMAKEMVRLRKDGLFDMNAFRSLIVMDDDEFITYGVTHRIKITITAEVGSAVVKREGFWYIRPGSLSPVVSLQ